MRFHPIVVKHSTTFGFVLFFIIACTLLILFAKRKEVPKEIKLETEKANDNQIKQDGKPEIITDPEVVEQDSEESFKSEQPSVDLEQDIVRNVSDRKFEIRSFQIHKKGLSKAECEDKMYISPKISDSALRLAVADGATESIFSDVWANILVKSYVEQGADFFNSPNLNHACQCFLQKTNQLISEMPETRQWFVYEKLDRGTHATLAAVEFLSPNKIQILTVGDSCIFWRSGEKDGITMFPNLSPAEFKAFPAAICHLEKTWHNLKKKILIEEYQIQDDLRMILCTDALACWLAKELQNDSQAWENLFNISDDISFERFIENLREQNNIQNDDVTLVLIHALPFNV